MKGIPDVVSDRFAALQKFRAWREPKSRMWFFTKTKGWFLSCVTMNFYFWSGSNWLVVNAQSEPLGGGTETESYQLSKLPMTKGIIVFRIFFLPMENQIDGSNAADRYECNLPLGNLGFFILSTWCKLCCVLQRQANTAHSTQPQIVFISYWRWFKPYWQTDACLLLFFYSAAVPARPLHIADKPPRWVLQDPPLLNSLTANIS